MLRLLGFLIVVGVLIAGSVWLADRPGAVTLQWLGWRADTTVPILLLFMVAVIGVLWALVHLVGRLFGIPGFIGTRLKKRGLRKGLRALTEGYAALVAGDAYKARKKAADVEAHLGEAGAARLLMARAAVISGDPALARDLNEGLLDDRSTEMAGLRGLMEQAMAAGRHDEAAKWAAKAFEKNPRAAWAAEPLFRSQAAAQEWDAALRTLDIGRKNDVFTQTDTDRFRAAILVAQVDAATAKGQSYEATRLAKRAVEADPGHLPAVLAYARALAAEGSARKAAEVIEAAWKRGPHPALAELYMGLYADEDALKRVTRAGVLAELNPEHVESRVVVAEAALTAELWGQARARLKPAVDAGVRDPRVAILMARLEEGERRDPVAAANWLRQAVGAVRADDWRCTACGTATQTWTPHCPSCGAFATLGWHTGGPLMTVATDGAAAAAQ